MEGVHDKPNVEEEPDRPSKACKFAKSTITPHRYETFRPITVDTEYVINGQERWGISRSPKIRPSKPNELSALAERIVGFHTHSFAYAAACAWIDQDIHTFGPDIVAKLKYELFIQGRI